MHASENNALALPKCGWIMHGGGTPPAATEPHCSKVKSLLFPIIPSNYTSMKTWPRSPLGLSG